MLKCIDHKECIMLENKCVWPRYHTCLEELSGGNFKGIEIKNNFETKAFFTKLARQEENLMLSKNPVDITNKKMDVLI